MLAKTKAIVLNSVRYQEKSIIVKCYTKQFGLTSYFVRNAFGKAKNAGTIAYFQPLSLLEITGNHKGKNTLEYFTELRLLHPYQTLTTDFTKSTVALFLSEILSLSIHEDSADPALYQFLETAFLWFDTHDFSPDFHLLLMVELTKYLGFYPGHDTSFPYFSPREGSFTHTVHAECFTEEETQLLKRLLVSEFGTATRFHQSERRLLLQLLITYYHYHISGFRSTKSLNVLIQLFSEK